MSDNGAGLSPDVDFRNTSSLGLQLVNTLVGQLEGDIELDSSHGTMFRITFAEQKSCFPAALNGDARERPPPSMPRTE